MAPASGHPRPSSSSSGRNQTDASRIARAPAIYRIGLTLTATRRISLPPLHHAVVHALLSEAYAVGADLAQPLLPDGVMPDAPEQGVISISPGEQLNLGFTYLGANPNPKRDHETIRALIRGVHRLGHLGPERRPTSNIPAPRPLQRSRPTPNHPLERSRPRLGGNYVLAACIDLASQQPLIEPASLADADRAPAPRRLPRSPHFVHDPQCIPPMHLQHEIDALADANELTLWFRSPLRMPRPRDDRKRHGGPAFLGDAVFDVNLMIDRLLRRIEDLSTGTTPSSAQDDVEDDVDDDGALAASADNNRPGPNIRVVENRLVWIDLPYGPSSRRKTLGGAVGRVHLADVPPHLIAPLVLGQYLRVGKNTRFGFGRYRIVELGAGGDEPFGPTRSKSLVDRAFHAPLVDELAAAADGRLGAGAVRSAVSRVLSGDYVPGPAIRLTIPRADGSPRQLSIPNDLDRLLQRCVLSLLAPAVDAFLETASMAYRRGLGRHQAAKRIEQLWDEGYRYALRSDIANFFDSVNHEMLRERLDGYLGDATLTHVVMQWVSAHAPPPPGTGLPTGSPLSPVLSNLFLDRFDEWVEAAGGRLVRYADDFLILYRTAEEAEAAWKVAKDAAERLALSLNEAKSAMIHLADGFTFLGFQFCCPDPAEPQRWQPNEVGGPPRPVDRLGWRDTSQRSAGGDAGGPPARTTNEVVLPGETGRIAPHEETVVIIGSDVLELDADDTGHELIATTTRFPGGRRVDLRRVEHLTLLGLPALTRRALQALSEHEVVTYFAPHSGIARDVLQPLSDDGDPDLIERQVSAARNPDAGVRFGRALIAAKLCNYAALASATDSAPAPEGRSEMSLAQRLRAAAESAGAAATVPQLMGIEGAAAAQWYRHLRYRVPKWCDFTHRVAPGASDPVNILLNIGFTILFREAERAARDAGLLPQVGLLHRPSTQFASLAADLMEPFRHLIDRCVIEACAELHPNAFSEAPAHDRFPVRVAPVALRRFHAHVHRVMLMQVRDDRAAAWGDDFGMPPADGPAIAAGEPTDEGRPMSYRGRLWALARSIRRALLDADRPVIPFVHPPAGMLHTADRADGAPPRNPSSPS